MSMFRIVLTLASVVLLLRAVMAEPIGAYADVSLEQRDIEERGDPCDLVKEVIEHLKILPDPYKWCGGYKPKAPKTTTVYKYETKYE